MSTSQDNSTDKQQPVSSGKPKSLWRNRDYMLLWSGQALSDIGGAVSGLAFPLLVLAVTHSPAQAGFVAALRALPAPLFSLFAGVLVDRWDRKRVMLVCDTGRALSLASIPIAFALRFRAWTPDHRAVIHHRFPRRNFIDPVRPGKDCRRISSSLARATLYRYGAR